MLKRNCLKSSGILHFEIYLGILGIQNITFTGRSILNGNHMCRVLIDFVETCCRDGNGLPIGCYLLNGEYQDRIMRTELLFLE